jgi:hypothetical protein
MPGTYWSSSLPGGLSSGSQSLRGGELCSGAALIVQDRVTRWRREVCEQSSLYLADMKDSLYVHGARRSQHSAAYIHFLTRYLLVRTPYNHTVVCCW